MALAVGTSAATLDEALASEPERATAPACGAGGPALDIAWADIDVTGPLERAVCDWFRDEPWQVRFSRPSLDATSAAPPAEGALRVVVRIEPPARAQLLVSGAKTRRWSHEVELPGPLDGAGVEVIAQALHSVVQAASEPAPSAPVPVRARASSAPSVSAASNPAPVRVADATAPDTPALVPDATAPDAPALVPDTPTRARDRAVPVVRRNPGPALPVHTGLGYLAIWRGDEPLVHGPALRIGVDAGRNTPTLGGFFRGALLTSGTRHAQGLSLRSSGVSLGAGASLAAPIGSGPLQARAALGAGIDLIALDVRVSAPTLRLAPDRRARPRSFLSSEAAVAWHQGPLEIELVMLLRWQLLHTTYELLDPDAQRTTVLEPWRLQPGASLAAAYVW